ncbi:cytochrome-c oxidase [Corynebacterium sp. 320]|uniref:Cytochrome c oxidase polypeptide 4 n=1 Tax=Corynebacterium zhongnanshanii TaxID=2768834 RepID=A0ABQ6VDL5_9CORY|nr:MULTISPECIES: cytochrome c oxidase subunit 4 [Corynebacterium]KAB1502475.1 cytochrome-c oxidase [Corynebacterium sp. 320]KAB1551304.1 cytochrome-c oxidase [Corynebacterium sp. 321]KAB1551868.1 cytochrome-c oxidase [Corynebacterium sp. 319]KAB3520843.1 cytochrome-c oxidase [Corynebacterium zhongnanshanii]KAB3526082.1 cytochrome-c oxidase [Corynebacterium sp. 250]
MASGAKLFYGIALFFAIVTTVYIIGTITVDHSAALKGIEWSGVVGMTLGGLLALMLAVYLHLTESKSDIGPADWEEAEIEDGEGVLGFFSASSIWPFAMTVSIVILGLGIGFWHYWLIVAGAVCLIYTATMLNLQYGLPPEKH